MKRRYYRIGKVLSTGIEKASVWCIELENGQKLTCTPNHKWLMKTQQTQHTMTWVKTDKIPELFNHYNRKYPPALVQLMPMQKFINDYEHGYSAGVFDAEGSLTFNKKSLSKMSFAQKDNELLKQTENFLTKLEFHYRKYQYSSGNTKIIYLQQSKKNLFRFLMATQPPRLLAKWKSLFNLYPLSVYNTDSINIINAYPMDEQEVVTLMTDTGTYIADGFGAHNTYKSNIVWVKTGLEKPGSGFYVRGRHELLFICTKGSFVPDQRDKEPIGSVVRADIGKHSEKPAILYKIIEKMYPEAKYLELFARKKREGWTCWGDEL